MEAMLVLRDQLLNIPIMSLQTGTKLGTSSQAIIDPHNLKIVAFYCFGPHIEHRPAVVHVSDIREFSHIGIIVDSSEVIMDPSELPRLQAILDLSFQLEGKLAVEENGHRIGRVNTYSVETTTFYISKLHINPPLLQRLTLSDIIIDRSQIISIDDHKIVVKQANVRAQESFQPSVNALLSKPGMQPDTKELTQ